MGEGAYSIVLSGIVSGSVTTARQNSLDIRLPEGVVFSLPLGGPAARFLAWLVDIVLAYALAAFLVSNLRYLGAFLGQFAVALYVIIYYLVPILYGMVFEGLWRGQTPGKRALRLRVMDAGGLRLEFRQVFIRNLLRAVDGLPLFYLVGGAACLLSPRAQRLGDLAADTVVVRSLPVFEPDLTQLVSGKYNTLRDHPSLAARLRQRIPPAEAGLALQALLRRNTLEPAARVELFSEVAGRFRAAVPLPEELAEDVTDEQYVRNVVDVLFHTRAADRKAS